MPNRSRQNRLTIRRLAFGAVMTALSVVMLYIGGFLEILDISMAALCGIIMQFSVIESTKGWNLAQYAGGCILSLTLMPFNFAGWSYLFLYGYYPILKSVLEGKIHKRALRILLKSGICLLSGGSLYLILRFFLQSENSTTPVFIFLGFMYILLFFIYDLLLSRIAVIYAIRFQPRFHLGLK